MEKLQLCSCPMAGVGPSLAATDVGADKIIRLVLHVLLSKHFVEPRFFQPYFEP